jgi:hypothetical protein
MCLEFMKNHPKEAKGKSDKKNKIGLIWTNITQRSRSNRENNIRWTPQGYRRRGRPKRTWRRK